VRSEFKTSNVAKPMKVEFFPEIRPNGGWSFPIDMSREDGHYLGLG
jgi:hypothetical protein